MRPKFVFVVLLIATLAVSAIVFLKEHSSAPTVPSAPAPMASAPKPAPTPAPVSIIIKKTMTPEERQAAIDAEKDKLFDWQVKNDPQSLSNILGDLVSPEKEIRMAAIEATKQFGSSNAIPVLKALAANTDDSEEAAALLDAADFLALTPMSDPSVQHPLTPEQIQADAQRNAQEKARHQAQLQAHQNGQQNPPAPANGQNQNQQSPAQP